jgi:hypothetical protein
MCLFGFGFDVQVELIEVSSACLSSIVPFNALRPGHGRVPEEVFLLIIIITPATTTFASLEVTASLVSEGYATTSTPPNHHPPRDNLPEDLPAAHILFIIVKIAANLSIVVTM